MLYEKLKKNSEEFEENSLSNKEGFNEENLKMIEPKNP
jgi:hypothetical protein